VKDDPRVKGIAVDEGKGRARYKVRIPSQRRNNPLYKGGFPRTELPAEVDHLPAREFRKEPQGESIDPLYIPDGDPFLKIPGVAHRVILPRGHHTRWREAGFSSAILNRVFSRWRS